MAKCNQLTSLPCKGLNGIGYFCNLLGDTATPQHRIVPHKVTPDINAIPQDITSLRVGLRVAEP